MLEFNPGHSDETENEDTEYSKPQICIERLLELRHDGKLTDQQIRDQVNLMLFAGQDTSSYTIAMTIFMLATHPKIEERVVNELHEVLGDLSLANDLTVDQVKQLVYLEQTIKETLRLYPVVPIIIRHCTQDTQLANFCIPANTDVLIANTSAHRRKDIWGPDADEFNPDHFDKEISSKRSPYAFMAFSHGSRDCLGQRFALISLKVILAKLLSKYRFSTQLKVSELKFRFEIICKPSNGINVTAERRY